MATLALLADAASAANHFIDVFIYVYVLLIFAYVLTSWVRLPFNVWVRRQASATHRQLPASVSSIFAKETVLPTLIAHLQTTSQ